jgi:hypothetical protein
MNDSNIVSNSVIFVVSSKNCVHMLTVVDDTNDNLASR